VPTAKRHVIELANAEKADLPIQRDGISIKPPVIAPPMWSRRWQDAEAIRAEADNYVLDVLNDLNRSRSASPIVASNGINDRVRARNECKARLEQAMNAPISAPFAASAYGGQQRLSAQSATPTCAAAECSAPSRR
jgi:hypothetical protein